MAFERHQSSHKKNHQTSITEFVTSSAEITADSCNLIRPHQKDSFTNRTFFALYYIYFGNSLVIRHSGDSPLW